MQDSDDIPYEEDIIRNQYSVKAWLRYILHKKEKKVPANQMNIVYERALRELPGRQDLKSFFLSNICTCLQLQIVVRLFTATTQASARPVHCRSGLRRREQRVRTSACVYAQGRLLNVNFSPTRFIVFVDATNLVRLLSLPYDPTPSDAHAQDIRSCTARVARHATRSHLADIH